MKVKYIQPDGTEQIVDVPDDVKQLNITLETPPVAPSTGWPAALVLVTLALCFTVVIIALVGGFRG